MKKSVLFSALLLFSSAMAMEEGDFDETKEVDTKGNLKVEIDSGSLKIKGTEGRKKTRVRVKYESNRDDCRFSVEPDEEDRLHIRAQAKRGKSPCKVQVFVETGTKFGSAKVKLGTGQADLEELYADELDVRNGWGGTSMSFRRIPDNGMSINTQGNGGSTKIAFPRGAKVFHKSKSFLGQSSSAFPNVRKNQADFVVKTKQTGGSVNIVESAL